MAEYFLGTQGWRHAGWLGSFYAEHAEPGDMLGIYAHSFNTVEVAESALAVPPGPVLRDWGRAVPPDFRFALTLPLAITHELRLQGGADLLFAFVERIAYLGERLGPVRIALSPAFHPGPDASRILANFLAALPSECRWAVEFRHRAWLRADTLALLRARNVAVVLADGRWLPRPRVLDLATRPTADFAYVRWSGVGKPFADVARPQLERRRELAQWRRALHTLSLRVEAVFGYAGNAFQGHAPHTVRSLVPAPRPEPEAAEVPWRQPQPV